VNDGRTGKPLAIGETLRDRRALIFMLVFLVITLASGVQGLPDFADGARIAWEAHLGGFAAGLLAYALVGRGDVRHA
jgi:membrane associated rhomboid family serine protease